MLHDVQNKYPQNIMFLMDESVKWENNVCFMKKKTSHLSLRCRNNSNLALVFLQSIDDLPNVDAILVVYSVDDEQSFNEAVQNIQFIRKEKVCNQAIILVANKADLERRRVVSEKGIILQLNQRKLTARQHGH